VPARLPPTKIAFVTDPVFLDNRLFAAGSRDGALEPYRILRHKLAEHGRLLQTADVYARAGDVPDLVICMDAPPRPLDSFLPPTWASIPKWAILGESEVTLARNWRPEVQDQFSRLFTWRRSMVDNERIFELNYPNPISTADSELSDPDRFCTLIAANKSSDHPLELYSKRREAIRWFERHHPDQFDLYGVGWDLLVVRGPRALRAVNRAMPMDIRRLLAPRLLSYRGTIKSKKDVLSRYRFSICFENAREIEDYITEKLFDCLSAGTIPIYWGAPNIAERVPPSCFIDFRHFDSYDELYAHLASLPHSAGAELREAGRDFLQSGLAKPWSTEAWVKTLVAHLSVGGCGAGGP
jgi:alpha(1,3/1,4) fucosyltransferase